MFAFQSWRTEDKIYRHSVLQSMATRPFAAFALVLAGTTAHAQELPASRSVHQLLELTSQSQITSPQDAHPASGQQIPMPPDPPAGAGGWSLRVHTSGGFTGQGIGTITISSDGQLACGPIPCATPIARLQLDPVLKRLASIVEASATMERKDERRTDAGRIRGFGAASGRERPEELHFTRPPFAPVLEPRNSSCRGRV